MLCVKRRRRPGSGPSQFLAILMSKLRLTNTPRKRSAMGKLLKLVLPILGSIGRPAKPCSAVRVDIKGRRHGQPVCITYGAADHMANLTGLPLAIGAVMLGRGDITQRGVVAPEACIPRDAFIGELAKRDIRIFEGDSLETPIN